MAYINNSVDQYVIERKLRPIYDFLDLGNNKKAVQEADKVLKKRPNLQCASVLKAVALQRLGKAKEASEIVNSIVDNLTNDDFTLQALTRYYRERHEPDLICSMYEKASKLDPTNEEILSHLFMAYVRVGDYKKQQHTAMQLYKSNPKNPYFFWSVMSIVMQSTDNCDSLSSSTGLLLAERMVKKFVKEDKIESEAEVITFLYILEMQDKFFEALEVLNGPLCERIRHQPSNYVSLKRGNYLCKLKQYSEAAKTYRNLIMLEPDNWQHYVNYTENILSLYCCDTSDSGSKKNNDILLEASEFIIDNREKAFNSPDLYRSPFLGLFQLALQLKEKGMQDKMMQLCGDVSELLFFYVERFGEKMCCFGDIVNFLCLIDTQEAAALLHRLSELPAFGIDAIPADIKVMHRNQLWMQLRRAFEVAADVDEPLALERGDELVALYSNAPSRIVKVPPTDIRPNDTHLILATHYYVSLFWKHLAPLRDDNNKADFNKRRTANIALSLCSLLERGAQLSKANFQMKLLLIKVYNLLGACESAYNVYENLDLKQIQLDTLGHVLSLQMAHLGAFEQAEAIFSPTIKFFEANFNETCDPLFMSYKYGSLTRIPEFVAFRERLNRSMHFSAVVMELIFINITTKTKTRCCLSETMTLVKEKSASLKTATEAELLRDNRDLTVMNSWQPKEKELLLHMKEETFKDEVVFIGLRSLLLQLAAAAYFRVRPRKKEQPNSEKSTLSNGDCDSADSCDDLSCLVGQVEAKQKICDSYRIKEHPQSTLLGPDISRIYLYSRGHHLPCIATYAKTTLAVGDVVATPKGQQSESDPFEPCLASLESCITFHTSQLQAIDVKSSFALSNRDPLMHLTHFVQTLSLLLVFLDSCYSMLNESNKNAKNRKKSGLKGTLMTYFDRHLTAIQRCLHPFDSALRSKLKSSAKTTGSEEIAEAASQLSSEPFCQNLVKKVPGMNLEAVLCALPNSALLSLKNISDVIKQKLAFIDLLRAKN